MDSSRLRLYAELDQKRLRLRREQEDIEATLKPLEEAILEEMSQDGVAAARVETDEGRSNVYLQRQVWAKCVDENWTRACAALVDAGLGEYVQQRYNTTSFSAYLRELDRGGVPLPEPLVGAIDAEVRLSVRTRKA